MSKRNLNILLSISALVIGGLIYILFRDNSYIAILFNHIPIIQYIRQHVTTLRVHFIKFYLPDLLWGFSLCSGLHAIYLPNAKTSVLCGITAFSCGAIWEIMQYMGILSGTGDLLDVLMYLFGCLVCIIINLRRDIK